MKGHIRKRGNRWSIVVDAGVHPETGRRRQRVVQRPDTATRRTKARRGLGRAQPEESRP